ncbi:MAG: hypothetical protein LZF62_230006 [Nitrospira sp.]|nr:MAG: hypothetical protein LZF62_230006 [Nitrospira sp.]
MKLRQDFVDAQVHLLGACLGSEGCAELRIPFTADALSGVLPFYH